MSLRWAPPKNIDFHSMPFTPLPPPISADLYLLILALSKMDLRVCLSTRPPPRPGIYNTRNFRALDRRSGRTILPVALYDPRGESICRLCTGKYHLALVFRYSILFTIKSARRHRLVGARVWCARVGVRHGLVFDGCEREREWSFCRNKTRLSNQARAGIDGPATIIAVMERAHLSAGRSGAQRQRFSLPPLSLWLFRGFHRGSSIFQSSSSSFYHEARR